MYSRSLVRCLDPLKVTAAGCLGKGMGTAGPVEAARRGGPEDSGALYSTLSGACEYARLVELPDVLDPERERAEEEGM